MFGDAVLVVSACWAEDNVLIVEFDVLDEIFCSENSVVGSVGLDMNAKWPHDTFKRLFTVECLEDVGAGLHMGEHKVGDVVAK